MSGLEQIAFGCMGLHPEKRQISLEAVGKALELGFRHFDNADLYPGPALSGSSEKLLGEALRVHGVPRESVVIASKCGIVFPQMREGQRFKAYDSSAGYVRSAVEASLRRMDCDYLDLFYIHRIDYLTAPQEVAGELEALRAEGKIRQIGLSNHDVGQVRAFARHATVDALQVEIS
ncbi:MAG: aldo/keto reductase [Verrucomicrobia bacterium]|nr:aldo/keto reductase [Verrucomicrobiota bacterium]MCH8510437.1 aldo/keto reductase [Kiritimatiellia bacterium]